MNRRDQGPRGGAEHLARIHGTEEDKVNCPFYFKIGACRHGDRCSRVHHKPPFSQTVIVYHMWLNPLSAVAAIGGDITQVDEGGLQEEFDLFYEEIFEELANFGELEEVQVCENLGDHMVGNVYVKYPDEEQAEECIKKIHGRYFAGRLLAAEFSPVTDFREARCRQYDEGTCTRGGFCNFLHIREPSPELRKFLEKEYNFRGGRQKGAAGMNTMRIATGDVAGRDKGRRDDDRFRDADRRRDRSRERDDGRGDRRRDGRDDRRRDDRGYGGR